MTKKILLGKKTLWWRICIPFAWIFWKCTLIPKLSWDEFKHGLISHKCKFEGPIKIYRGIKFDTCLHYGCNTVDEHEHRWEFQYRTGNPFDGKSEVCKCRCGQWAVRHYGQPNYQLISK